MGGSPPDTNSPVVHNAMTCSIVIPTRLRVELLSQTLKTLEGQTDSNFEVVVVSDGKDPQTESLADSYHPRYPLVWAFSQETHGQGEARNVGARKAKGDLLLFLDDDTTPCPEWVARHKQHHLTQTVTEHLVVLGRLRHVYGRPPHSHTERLLRELFDACQNHLTSLLARMDHDAAEEFWVGLNTSIRRDLYLACGQADPNLQAVQEDAELAWRLVQKGFRFIYEPDAVIQHHESKDLVKDRIHRAHLFGISDVYRVRDKGQSAAMWPNLAAIHCYPKFRRRWVKRFAWQFPRVAYATGELARVIADRSGSTFFFRLWDALCFSAEYWKGVRSQGVTLESLCALVTADSHQALTKLSAPGTPETSILTPK